MALTSRELVQLYHWLAEVLWWRNRYDEMIRLGEEGSTLLGEDTNSIEAALMNDIVAVACRDKGQREKAREHAEVFQPKPMHPVQFCLELIAEHDLRPHPMVM